METSTRLTFAAAFLFIAPFALSIPGSPGMALALSLVILAWATGTNTTVEPALVVLFLYMLPTRAAYDGADILVEGLIAAFAVTVLLSICFRRVSPTGVYEAVRRGLASISVRLFSPPGVRGTVHARWFAPGLLFVFLLIVTLSTHQSRAILLGEWLILFTGMWMLRWIYPRWEPASLARASLFVSAQPLFHLGASPAVFFMGLPITMVLIALAWALFDTWTERRLWSGRHPRWVMAEHRVIEAYKEQRVVLRERVLAEGYRASTRGFVVGSLRTCKGAREEVVAVFVLCAPSLLISVAGYLLSHHH